ncbi:MAG: hypothetical protein AAGG06_14490 [Pseudomonadota bacterium]
MSVIAEPVLAACVALPTNQLSTLCKNRVPAADRIKRFVGSSLLWYICDSPSGQSNPLEYDRFLRQGGFPIYKCTSYRTCNWANINDPEAHNKFC